MEFSAEKIAGSNVRCLATSLDVYEGVLAGFDGAFNTVLRDARVTGPSLNGGETGSSSQATAASATSERMFVNGSRLLYIGFCE